MSIQSMKTLLFLCAIGYVSLFVKDVTNQRLGIANLLNAYIIQDSCIHWKELNTDMRIHHMATLFLGFMLASQPYFEKHWHLVAIVISTEISTIFLSLRALNILKPINTVLFVITFFYYRTFRLGNLVFFEIPDDGPILLKHLLYILYSLNLYWTVKIFQKLFRNLYG